MTSLSIIMPAYNEERTIAAAVEEVRSVDYPCDVELIVVDDGSTDTTGEILDGVGGSGVSVVRLPTNLGKGAAVRAGVARAVGSHVMIFDADLEYCPSDIPTLLAPVITGHADHVFGTRVFGLNTRFQSFRFAMGGRATTLFANLIFDSCLTDMHTCLKLVPRQDFENLGLAEVGFGLDTQLTARLLRAGVRPYEVPITYRGRSFAEGKKIGWRDGVRCMQVLLQVRLRGPRPVARAIPVPSPSVDVAFAGSLPAETLGSPALLAETAAVDTAFLGEALVEVPLVGEPAVDPAAPRGPEGVEVPPLAAHPLLGICERRPA